MTSSHLGALNGFCWVDVKTHDVPGAAVFFSAVPGRRFAVGESDGRRATKISADGHQIGGVSDLGSPLRPPGTPARIAHYLTVDDVQARTEAATAAGPTRARALRREGQGRIATLIHPVGAAFSLWQTHPSRRWAASAHTPQRMVLARPHPEQACRFHRNVLGTVPGCADFVPVDGLEECTLRWELLVAVDDPDTVAAHARAPGEGMPSDPITPATRVRPARRG
ncbi:VOC family protein [Streptomyces sp. YIM B13518]|uniref:VOC family protein n=1 Tax=Streptomyces sp. YIM B13518 TaxID=3366316 RepID=UPI0036AC526B